MYDDRRGMTSMDMMMMMMMMMQARHDEYGHDDGPRRHGHAPHPRLLRRARPQGPGGEAADLADQQDGEGHRLR